MDITVEKIVFAISQFVRMYTITVLAITIPYTIDQLLRRHLPRDGLAGQVRLRHGPGLSLCADAGAGFSVTRDAQRARGYEVEKLSGGIFAQIRKLAPLLVPVTINAIVGAEDIIDAMDLRAFGVRPRTWVHQLTYTRDDKVLIAIGVLIFVASTVLAFMEIGTLWIPTWAMAWAR